MEWKLNGKRFHNRIVLIFSVGFLAALAVVYLGKQNMAAAAYFPDLSGLVKLDTLEPDKKQLMFYCLKQRMGPAACLIGLTVMGAGGFGALAFLLWYGFGAGLLLALLSLRWGFRGSLIFAAGIFPQILFLVPACLLLLEWCVTFVPKGGYSGKINFNGWKKILTAILLLTVACTLESYVNPLILKKLLQF